MRNADNTFFRYSFLDLLEKVLFFMKMCVFCGFRKPFFTFLIKLSFYCFEDCILWVGERETGKILFYC